MLSRPLRLTDQELDAVFAAARPLEPGLRDPFLQAVANALNGAGEIGPSSIRRTSRPARCRAGRARTAASGGRSRRIG